MMAMELRRTPEPALPGQVSLQGGEDKRTIGAAEMTNWEETMRSCLLHSLFGGHSTPGQPFSYSGSGHVCLGEPTHHFYQVFF